MVKLYKISHVSNPTNEAILFEITIPDGVFERIDLETTFFPSFIFKHILEIFEYEDVINDSFSCIEVSSYVSRYYKEYRNLRFVHNSELDSLYLHKGRFGIIHNSRLDIDIPLYKVNYYKIPKNRLILYVPYKNSEVLIVKL